MRISPRLNRVANHTVNAVTSQLSFFDLEAPEIHHPLRFVTGRYHLRLHFAIVAITACRPHFTTRELVSILKMKSYRVSDKVPDFEIVETILEHARAFGDVAGGEKTSEGERLWHSRLR